MSPRNAKKTDCHLNRMLKVAVAVWLLSGMASSQFASAFPQDPVTEKVVEKGAEKGVEPGIQSTDAVSDLLDGLDLQAPVEAIPTIPDDSEPLQAPPTGSGADARAFGAINTLFEAFRSMQQAEQLLTRGQTDQDVVKAQRRAVDLLDELIKTQQQQSQQQQQQQQSQQQQSQQQSTSPQESGESPDDQEQAESAASSGSESPDDQGDSTKPQESVPAAGIVAPLNAAGEGVWGHLPQKTRGMLRADIPTDYLPGYSRQISEYFKALAELPSDT